MSDIKYAVIINSKTFNFPTALSHLKHLYL